MRILFVAEAMNPFAPVTSTFAPLGNAGIDGLRVVSWGEGRGGMGEDKLMLALLYVTLVCGTNLRHRL